MASYPKWLYHPSKPAVVVKDEAEHKELGAGWVESPADLLRPAEPKRSGPEEALLEPALEKHKRK